MTDDAELLLRFAREGSQADLAELVRRHIDFVYQTALREVGGNAHSAADVTQDVFLHVARKAARLAGHRVLKGWLFTTTRYLAANLARAEQRRRHREEKAHAMQTIDNDAAPSADWSEVRPLINGALGALSARDREAVLLRYFEGRDYAEIGARFSLSADAARLRVERSLEKMRAVMARRGVTSGTAALAGALSTQAGIAAPAGLAGSVTATALAGATTAGAAGGIGGLTFMSITKLQVGVAGAVLASGAVAFVLQGQTNAELRDEAARLRQQGDGLASVQADNVRLGKIAAEANALERDAAAVDELRREAAQLRRAARTAAGEPAVREDTFILTYEPVGPVPAPRAQVMPTYPDQLRQAGLTSHVTMALVVDEEGRATQIEASGFTASSRRPGPLPSSTSLAEAFQVSAREALSQWRFEPVLKDGRPISVPTQITLRYSAEGTVSVVPPTDTANADPTKPRPWF